MMSVFTFLVAGASAVIFNDMAQGAKFDKCILISHFTSKTLTDDVTVVDRLATGCCPKDYTAGAKWKTAYKGAQIVCGFKADGSVSTSTISSSKTCTLNQCYVDKQHLPCADASKQLLNGCCAATTKSNTGFPATCLNYWLAFTTVEKDEVRYCTTYHKDYSALGKKGTTNKTDDQAGGLLVPANINTYTPCDGGGSTGSTAAKKASSASSFGMMAVAGAALHSLIF